MTAELHHKLIRRSRSAHGTMSALGHCLLLAAAVASAQGLCPQPPACEVQKYRTADGSCNNPQKPSWGQADSTLLRLLPPQYGDDMRALRRQKNTSELPGARFLSNSLIVTTSESHYDNYTLMLMQWWQFLDHDLTYTPVETHAGDGSHFACCTEDGKNLEGSNLNPSCAPINVEPSDTFYPQYSVECLNFVRSVTRADCKFPKKREQINSITAFIDASNVYGSSEHEESLLRTFSSDGKMITNNVTEDNLLPGQIPEEFTHSCTNVSPNKPCFQAGDARVNLQPNPAAMHTVFVQYHNILASRLRLLNPHWSGNTTYQEARRIIGAVMQHITYAEFLPIVLGENKMRYLDMLPLPATSDQYKDTYDPSVNPAISNVFATSAFRFDTLVDSQIVGLSGSGSATLNESLSDVQFNVSALYQKGAVENQLRGLSQLPSPKFDNLFSPEITQFLFKGEKPFGMDLVALNLQRGRDHGLPGYSKWREFCGKPAATTFDDLSDVIHRRTAEYMQNFLYNHVEDVDIFVGQTLEKSFDDALVGHTLVCLLSDQFYRLQRGDRFYYENGGLPNSFTPAQLQELRRSSLRQVMCAVSPNLQLQPNVFVVADAQQHRAPCNILPSFNLDAWKE